MGEAKRNREALKALALAQMERWDFSPSEAEAEAVSEISQLPIIQVNRYPPHILKQMGMPPNHCHANARFMVDNDPEKRCQQISGWWPQSGTYVLHSVVKRGNDIFCVTPTAIDVSPTFPFIIDQDIEWREEGDHRVPYRKGLAVEPGLRADPVEHKRIANIVRERIESGVHPLEAGKPPFDRT